MSLTVTTDVFCDAEGCVRWTSGDTGTRVRARAARTAARRRGWATNPDLCPFHNPSASDLEVVAEAWGGIGPAAVLLRGDALRKEADRYREAQL